MDKGPRPRKFKAAIVEGEQWREISRFILLDGNGKGFSCHCHRSRLAGGNATRKRKEGVERTCEGVIVLTQSDDGMELRVIGSLF